MLILRSSRSRLSTRPRLPSGWLALHTSALLRASICDYYISCPRPTYWELKPPPCQWEAKAQSPWRLSRRAALYLGSGGVGSPRGGPAGRTVHGNGGPTHRDSPDTDPATILCAQGQPRTAGD